MRKRIKSKHENIPNNLCQWFSNFSMHLVMYTMLIKFMYFPGSISCRLWFSSSGVRRVIEIYMFNKYSTPPVGGQQYIF
jgi:hypothetical protein